MKKELLNCINDRIREQRIESNKKLIEFKKQGEIEELEKQDIIKEVEEFFKGFKGYILIPLRLKKPIPEHLTDGGKWGYEPIFYGSALESIEIFYDSDILEIRGTEDTIINKFNNSYPWKQWSIDRLRILKTALPWIEEQIAKKYGCLKE